MIARHRSVDRRARGGLSMSQGRRAKLAKLGGFLCAAVLAAESVSVRAAESAGFIFIAVCSQEFPSCSVSRVELNGANPLFWLYDDGGGLAVDDVNQRVYFTGGQLTHPGTIRRATFNGSSQQ